MEQCQNYVLTEGTSTIHHTSPTFTAMEKKLIGQRMEHQPTNETFIDFKNTEFYVKGRRN